jgi:hypothetical protein
MPYIREDQADIRLFVDGIEYGDGNSWATWAGGDLTAAGSKTRPGGMGKQKAQGGPATRSDITVTIQNSDTMIGQLPTLESRVGKGNARVVATYLNDEGETIAGAQLVRTGKLKTAEPPGQNYDSAAVGMFTVVVDCDEVAG